MSIKRRPPRDQLPAYKVEEGDIAVLDHETDQDAPSWRRAASSVAIGAVKASSASITPTKAAWQAALPHG